MRRPTLLLGLLLVVLACLANAPALEAGFLWDDDALTTNSNFESLAGLWQLWVNPNSVPLEQHYWPVTYTSFWIEAQLWGLAPGGLHATNLALHALNCLLLWGLLGALGLRSAWWVAAIFAVHPIHVESVAWIIERKDLLSATFYLMAAHAYLASERAREAKRSAGPQVVALFLCYLLGAWSKSVALSLPIALGLVQWARRGTLRRREVALFGSLLVLGVALAGYDLARSSNADSLAEFSWTLGERIGIAGRALSFYGRSLAIPVGLTPVVPYFEVGGLQALVHPIGWTAVLAVLYLRRGQWTRWPAALLSIWFVTLAPMLCLIPFSWMRHSFVADRFQYLASAAGLVLLVLACERVLARFGRSARGWIAAGVVGILGFLSFQYTGIFAHEESHARRITEYNPSAWVGHFNLAMVLRREGDLQGALLANDRAIEARPDFAGSHNNRGDLLMSMGREVEARDALLRALELDPELPTAHNNLGLLYTESQDWDHAREQFDRAIELRPEFAVFRVNLGLLYAKSGRLEPAEQAFERALELEPGNAIALQSLETIRKLRAAEQ